MPDLCTIDDAKAWLAIRTDGEDPVLSRLVSARSDDLLREISRMDLMAATYTEVREGDGADYMVLRHWPINTIASVSIGGTAVTASADKIAPGYYIDADVDPERRWQIYLAGGLIFSDSAPIVVVYNGGYADVPNDIEQAMIEWVADSYRSRQWIGQSSKHMATGESVATPQVEIPPAVRRVIDRYRRGGPLHIPPNYNLEGEERVGNQGRKQ